MRIGVVDLGGTKIAVGVVDENGKLSGRREEPTLPERGFERALERIVSMLHEARDGASLDGIAIASTGPIDRDTGVFGKVDVLPGFEGCDLKQGLVGALGAHIDIDIDIVIENDADAAALGEATYGATSSVYRFLYVTISTGIGAGIVIDGAIYRGANGTHPELGHHIIEASAGPPCPCGGKGCWEILASGPAMVAAARTLLGAQADAEALTAETICRAAERGEPWAMTVVEREGFYLGVGLSNLIAMFAPQMIVLGGGVMRSAHLFLDRARAVIKTSCTLVPSDPEQVTIVTTKLGGDAGLLGAARAFLLKRTNEQ